MSTHDDMHQHTEDALRAFVAPRLVTTPLVHLNPAILAGRASLDAFADQQLRNERALEEAARQAMLKEAFEGVPDWTPTAAERLPDLTLIDVIYSVDVWGTVHIDDYTAIVGKTLKLSFWELFELDPVLSLMADEIALAQAERTAQRRAEDRAAHKSWDLNR